MVYADLWKNRKFAKPQDTSELLNKHDTKYVQQVVGSFLYYARAIYTTILPAINEISARQAHPTKNSIKKIQQLMDDINTYTNPKIRFNASNMILYIDSDAAYLVVDKAKSGIAGFYYVSDKDSKQVPTPPFNGTLHIQCKELRHVFT